MGTYVYDVVRHLLKITVDVAPPDVCLRLRGEMDFSCPPLLDALARVELIDVTVVIVDLEELAFVDAAAMCDLLAFRAAHTVRGRQVRLIRPSRPVGRLFHLLGEGGCLETAA